MLKNLKHAAKEIPELVIYVYSTWQSKYDEFLHLVDYFIEDDNDLEKNIKKYSENKSVLLVLDDMMNSKNLKYFMQLFTVQARHNAMSVIFISQKLFAGDEMVRTIHHNSDYILVHRNLRNNQQIVTLANQMSPGNKTLVDIFLAATEDPYSYLLIDLTQECPKHLKYRSHMFDTPHVMKVYVEN